MRSQVSVIKCKSYNPQELYPAVRKSLDLIGGINSFVKRSDKVLIKPNLLCACTPDKGIDTHPEFARAVIKIVKETGAEIFLGDAPSVWGTPEDVDSVYELSGMRQVCYEEKVRLVDFNQGAMVSNYPLASWTKECNRIISLPKFKTHDLMVLTGAIKNLFGLIPGLSKTELHRRAMRSDEFAKVLVDIYELAKPTVSIVDGIVAMEGDGPASGGTLRDLGLIIASSDAVALDSVMATIVGLRPEDIFSTKEAYARKLGNMHLSEIEVLGEKLAEVIVPDFKIPQLSILNRMPKPFLSLGKKLIRFRAVIDRDKCRLCGLCAKGCPAGAISQQPQAMVIEFNRCVLCMCCKEVCPEGAVFIRRNPLLGVIKWLLKLLNK
ncbi:MAG: DUF362 domain-containing protein [Candidatus Omnitrophota bacterium]|nr:DUF362 domain-containing protein [Candidatus Omnitrophota bacterium]